MDRLAMSLYEVATGKKKIKDIDTLNLHHTVLAIIDLENYRYAQSNLAHQAIHGRGEELQNMTPFDTLNSDVREELAMQSFMRGIHRYNHAPLLIRKVVRGDGSQAEIAVTSKIIRGNRDLLLCTVTLLGFAEPEKFTDNVIRPVCFSNSVRHNS